MILFRPLIAVSPHVFAGAVALTYAWYLAQTPWRVSAAQFLSPLILIILVHLVVLALRGRLRPGFAGAVFGQAFLTSVAIMAVLIGGALFAPQPAQADVGEAVETLLIVVFCAAYIAMVMGVAALAIYLVYRFLMLFVGLFRDDGPKSRLFDVGGVVVCCLGLGVASLEGMPQGFSLSSTHEVTASHFVAKPTEDVWRVMGTATSPDFPLPGILAAFPRPVAVSTDEGVGLGANRRVLFEGREGAGALHLRVTERDAQRAVFTFLSDTTPYAGWIGYRQLTYTVVPEGAGTRLSVSLEFDRKLAPSWFFGPVMRGAAYLAADVLVRDVKERAERG
ncbi:SRPBCC family protein [Yoonia sp. 2307UL14-13]|uniref:SRPBCC family protein n=1 Tax=Yoonia sp. 2307UL14-13 TaxID=3126506 RepID=UPI0030B27D2D